MQLLMWIPIFLLLFVINTPKEHKQSTTTKTESIKFVFKNKNKVKLNNTILYSNKKFNYTYWAALVPTITKNI
jgi:hypothetical protein